MLAPRPEALQRARRFPGKRLVTDFGLAKRLAEARSLVHRDGPGAGHARYMAPEQAAGRKDLTVAADVYSLGVILYERLTGQTPFTGENVATLLRQVPSPSRRGRRRSGRGRSRPGDRGAEVPGEGAGPRYPSAEALADDLDRWLRGEPIQARPVGQAERFWRWCRRNPVVRACGAVAASLFIGIVASTYFAVAETREPKTGNPRREEHGGHARPGPRRDA